MVMIDLRIGDHLGRDVGLWSSINSRPDTCRYGMVNGLMNQGCNVGWGVPEFSRVGTTWNYNGHDPYVRQSVLQEKIWERQMETADRINQGRMTAEINRGYYGNYYGGVDRGWGGGSQIAGLFNSRSNFVDFNFANNSFGRPVYGGGPRTSVNADLNIGGVQVDVGVNNLLRRFV